MKQLIAFFAILAALILPCAAGNIGLGRLEDNLPKGVEDMLVRTEEDSVSVEDSLRALYERFCSSLREQIKGSAAGGFMVLAICALAAVVRAFGRSSSLPLTDHMIDVSAILAVLTVSFGQAQSVLGDCARAIDSLSVFSKALIPTFAAATALSGKPVSAAASAGATILFSSLLVDIAKSIVLPMISVYIVAACTAQIGRSELIERVAGLIKWASGAFFKVFLTAFTAYLSVSGLIAGSTDNAALKTAKATIAGVVPVLGSMVADASDALLGGAAALRSAVGLYGFIAACAICLVPFVRALTHYFVFKLVAAVACSLSPGGVAKAVDGITGAYSVAIGLLGTCCAVQFIAIVVSTVVIRT